MTSGLTSAGAMTGVKPAAVGLRHRQVHQRELQLRADAGEEVEPRAGDLGAAFGVDRLQRGADLDVVARIVDRAAACRRSRA